MRVFGRLLIALAVLLPVMVVAAGAASGRDGTAVMKCMHWEDAMRATPGFTRTPSNQDVAAHGRINGCNKAGGGGMYKARLHATNATCGHFSLSGTARFDWANGKSSTANLIFQQQPAAPYKYLVIGQITSGLFDTLVVQSFLRFGYTFTGTGPACTATNPLKRMDFTNTRSLQLFQPPETTTTTVPRRPTTTTDPPGTTVPRNTTTVPIATQGSTTTTTATPVTQGPASTVSQSGGGG
jgi:hypothetical protein